MSRERNTDVLGMVIRIAAAATALAMPLRGAEAPFVIRVVDDATGRGVPLVELETTDKARYYTDSNGIVTFHEPGLMGRRVFFHVRSHGYDYPKDGFGYRGKALQVKPGGHTTLRLRRLNVAERLYRVTGAGIYRDSYRAGESVPIQRPLLNASVTGQDSVLTAVFRGKIWWFWGDTNRVRYPLGNFHTPGAVSELPARGGLDPEVGVDLNYFVGEDGFVRSLAKIPGEGPTWLSGLVVLGEPPNERMFAHYAKIRPGGGLEAYERGLVEFDTEEGRFVRVGIFPQKEPFPHGAHTFVRESGGTAHVYYCAPYPLLRVRADPGALQDQAAYEAFTPLRRGVRKPGAELDRDDEGMLRYAWKRDTAPVLATEQEKLIRAGHLREDERLLALRDVESGKIVVAHRGTVAWNRHRRRWVMVFCETFGTSLLGEIWYAEADRPLGPWVYARKVVTHDRYSFYNPRHHPFFDKEGGRILFFEGTYTATFSGNPVATPRYDYNQIMYKLDLADSRLKLPVAVYEKSDGAPPGEFVLGVEDTAGLSVAFWAFDRPSEGAVPVFASVDGNGVARLSVGGAEGAKPTASKPLFWAFPSGVTNPPAAVVPLWEFVQTDGERRAYGTEDRAEAFSGYERTERPVTLVWPHAGPRAGPWE